MKEKEILLIGRSDSVTWGIDDYLSKFFAVQLCADRTDAVESMFEISEPDLVVISLVGFNAKHADIFSELRNNHSSIPCICIGTTVEQEPFGQYLKTRQFVALNRPINNSELLVAVNDQFDKRKTILVIDDNPLQLRALKALLQKDYEIEMAISCAEALMAIEKDVPDLIILDYEMPVCNGKETLEMICNIEEAEDVPVIFLTAVSDESHIKAVL